MAIPLTSDSVPTARIDGDPKHVALLREAAGFEVEGGVASAGRVRKGRRAEYRCAACGYGIIVYGQPPGCPMCCEPRWDHVEWRPFSHGLDEGGDGVRHAATATTVRLRASPQRERSTGGTLSA